MGYHINPPDQEKEGFLRQTGHDSPSANIQELQLLYRRSWNGFARSTATSCLRKPKIF